MLKYAYSDGLHNLNSYLKCTSTIHVSLELATLNPIFSTLKSHS